MKRKLKLFDLMKVNRAKQFEILMFNNAEEHKITTAIIIISLSVFCFPF